MTNFIDKKLQALTEKWADIEHTRWAKWQKYMHSKMKRSYDFTTYNLPEELYRRWERQIATDYKDLSEREKESDREQVYPYIEDVRELMKEVQAEKVKEIVRVIEDMELDYGGATDVRSAKFAESEIKRRLINKIQ